MDKGDWGINAVSLVTPDKKAIMPWDRIAPLAQRTFLFGGWACVVHVGQAEMQELGVCGWDARRYEHEPLSMPCMSSWRNEGFFMFDLLFTGRNYICINQPLLSQPGNKTRCALPYCPFTASWVKTWQIRFLFVRWTTETKATVHVTDWQLQVWLEGHEKGNNRRLLQFDQC